ncbi:ornithine cyclodeaminase family protein [Microbacterium sp. NPDC078428]|uniref:ornithine cyclodeaminase family protein n=1 Tax=Microbacterium sp. NPDC078428 TaxID=3364190 RepID=UPI0037C65247
MTKHNDAGPLLLSASQVRSRIDPERARSLIEEALLSGFDPMTDPARVVVEAGSGDGHLLMMPSTLGKWAGVKMASVSPDNPRKGAPRIQAMYLLMDADTLTPRLILDGTELTKLRTAATTAVAVDRLAGSGASKLVVFGSGAQAISHVIAFSKIRGLSEIRLIGRSIERTASALRQLAAHDILVALGEAGDVADADIVLCATTAQEPLFPADWVKDGTCVAAIGSHRPDQRELPGSLLARSQVIVEDRDTALREAGDIVLAIQDGDLNPNTLVTIAELVKDEVRRDEQRPNVFKGTGMAWQDLAIAAGLAQADLLINHENEAETP